jgi:hypothetical protein
MGLTVGELAVELEAKTGDFKRGLASAEARLDRFEDGAKRRTAGAARGFKSLAGSIAKVGIGLAALGTAIAAVGFSKLISGSLQTSAQFEQLKIRLATFLGSQDAANESFEKFVELSAKTPFSVGQIVEGAATLATVTGEDQEALEGLVKVTANLAALTGLDFPAAAGNLQRALSSGLAAADLFRDKGIRQLIEKELDLNDATKLSVGAYGDLAKAFQAVAGEGAKYGSAAEDLSNTLGGAFSNVGDSAQRLQAAIGDALAPGVIDAFRGIIIPFLDKVRGMVEANSEEISDLASKVIPKLFDGFKSVLQISAVLVRGLGFVIDAWDGMRIIMAAVQTVLVALFSLWRAQIAVIRLAGTVISNGASAVKAALKGNLVEAASYARKNEEAWELFKDRIVKAKEDVIAAADVVVDLATETAATSKWTDELAASLESVAAAAGRVQINVDKAGDAVEKAGNQAAGAAPKFAPGGVLPALGATPEGDTAYRLETADFFKEEAGARKIAGILGETEGVLGKGSPETEAAIDEFSESLAEGVVDGIGGALFELARSGGDLQAFAQSLGQLSEQFLTQAFEKATEALQANLSKALENLGPGVGAALAGALGIGLGLIAGAMKETVATETNAAIKSAVTSTQQLRGIVAGPTQVAIGQVATGIEEAFQPMLELDRRRNALLEDLLRTSGSAPSAATAGAPGATEEAVATTSVSLP